MGLKRKESVVEPLSHLGLFQVLHRLNTPERRDEARKWVAEHREQLEAHARGVPYSFGKVDPEMAARVLARAHR